MRLKESISKPHSYTHVNCNFNVLSAYTSSNIDCFYALSVVVSILLPQKIYAGFINSDLCPHAKLTFAGTTVCTFDCKAVQANININTNINAVLVS